MPANEIANQAGTEQGTKRAILFRPNERTDQELSRTASLMRLKPAATLRAVIERFPRSEIIDYLARLTEANAYEAVVRKVGCCYDADFDKPAFHARALRRCRLTAKDKDNAVRVRNATVLGKDEGLMLGHEIRTMLAPILTCEDAAIAHILGEVFAAVFSRKVKSMSKVPRLREHCRLLAKVGAMNMSAMRQVGPDADRLQALIHASSLCFNMRINTLVCYADAFGNVTTGFYRRMTFDEVSALVEGKIGAPMPRTRFNVLKDSGEPMIKQLLALVGPSPAVHTWHHDIQSKSWEYSSTHEVLYPYKALHVPTRWPKSALGCIRSTVQQLQTTEERRRRVIEKCKVDPLDPALHTLHRPRFDEPAWPAASAVPLRHLASRMRSVSVLGPFFPSATSIPHSGILEPA